MAASNINYELNSHNPLPDLLSLDSVIKLYIFHTVHLLVTTTNQSADARR